MVNQQQVDELAWDVVEFGRERLTVGELNAVFIQLGTGEYESAIEAILKRLALNRLVLPTDLHRRLTDWLSAFQDSPLHARLSSLLRPDAEP